MRRRAEAEDVLRLPVTAPRAVGYIRVSTEEQADDGVSLEVQEEALRRAAAQEGFALVEVLRDEGISAFKDVRRPAFDAMMKRLPEFDVVMVWKLDRFGRRTKKILGGIEEITELGKRFYSVLETLDTDTPFGKFALTNMAALAQLESETTQVRVLPAVKASVEKGLHHGAPNYGYRLDELGVQEIMREDPATAPILRRIYSEYATGKPAVRIVRDLNAEGIPTARKGQWQLSTLMRLLTCPVYIGMVQHNPSGLLTKGLHEPLIDIETWEQVQRRIKRSKKVAPRARHASLAPLLRCALCKGPISAHTSIRPNRTDARYICGNRHVNPGIHESLGISQPILHHYIWGTMDLLLSPTTKMQLAIQWSQVNAGPDQRLARLRDECAQLENSIAYNLTAAREAGLPHKILAKQNGPLQERLAEVEQEIEDIAMEEPRLNIPQLRSQMDKARQLGFEAQRDYLGQLFSHIEVGHEAITFFFCEEGAEPLKIRRESAVGKKKHQRAEIPIVPLPS